MDLASASSVLAAAAEDPAFGATDVLTAALGFVAAVLLTFVTSKFPKGRLEHRLLELQVEEKERAREAADAVAGGTPEQVVRMVARPLLESRVAQDLLLRFVLLYLLIQAWGIVANLLGTALASAQFALNRAVEGDYSTVSVIGYVLVALVASIPGIVRSLLFVAIGWPLLLEVARVLRFGLPEYLYRPAVRRVLIGFVVVAALVEVVMGTGITLLPF